MTNTTCEQCRTTEGASHAFHYGRVAPAGPETVFHASAYPSTQSAWHDRYQIGGIETVVLCNSCLARTRARHAGRVVLREWIRVPLVALGYLAWAVALVLWAWQGAWWELALGAVVGLGITAAVYVVAYRILQDEDFAQHLAVDLHQEQLREQGWDAFWTDNEFAHLAPH